MTADQLWQAALAELELSLSKANFTTWFKNTFILSYENNSVVVGVPNAFTKTWLENKYHAQILRALQNITEQKVKEVTYKVFANQKKIAKIITQEVKTEEKKEKLPTLPAKKTHPIHTLLNNRYTFETFVVGKKNELAHAACLAVADKPGTVYNPLFIYGGVGLGKTHLMQAIGHRILEKQPDKKILYVPCETFTNEYINSVGRGEADSFKDKYRSVDLLMIDDIQFLAGKEGTQEAFFHTFNALHQTNKQIVITSDRPPKAIPTLENRLISRFEWGMIVDIGLPDLETRIAILKNKCQEKGFSLENEVVVFIATTVQNNIRELEGALNRVIASTQLSNDKPTLEVVKKLLSSLTQAPKKGALTAKKVITAVSEYFEIKAVDITGNCRKKELVVPRQIAMYLMREEMNSSYPNIGEELGGRDHTTAMHAYNKIVREIENNEKLQQDLNLIKQKLYN
ncbi:MAG: chromosomal replication initiator protein DnaA [Patescibacteria group bacterium]|jgi:chromosomal replication initiator protein